MSAFDIQENYPTHVPILLESKTIEFERIKYLIPKTFTFGQAISVIRRKIKVKSSDGIFYLVKNTMIPTTYILGDVYNKHKDKDTGFLIIHVSKESVFGSVY